MIEKVERFICGHCGYITEAKHTVERIKKTGKCPACGSGEPKAWRDASKRTEWAANQ